jgi:hypothetical protein
VFFHFIGSRVETRPFQAMGQLLKPGAFKLWGNWMQLVQPHHERLALLGDLGEQLEERLVVRPDVVVHQLVQHDQDVAVQAAFESKGLKPGSHISGSRVEIETRRFSSSGVNCIQLVQPPPARRARSRTTRRGVAAQVTFESKGLKPVNHLIGSRVGNQTRAPCKLWGNWIQLGVAEKFCVPHTHLYRPPAAVVAQLDAHALPLVQVVPHLRLHPRPGSSLHPHDDALI